MTRAHTVHQNGLAIRSFRIKDGWNLSDFAEHFGVPKGTISRIELEERMIQISFLNQIASALNVPPAALIRNKVREITAEELEEPPVRKAS